MFALPLVALASKASVVASAVTGVAGAVGQYKAGKAQEDAANRNADILENEKQQRLSDSLSASARKRYNNSRDFDRAVARQGSSGTVFSGSKLDTLEEYATDQELGLIDASTSAQRQARQNEQEQSIQRYNGRVAGSNAKYQAFGTLLSTGTNVARQNSQNVNNGQYKSFF